MKKLNQFLLKFIIRNEMKHRDPSDAVTGIYFEIASYLDDNYSSFEGIRIIDPTAPFLEQNPTSNVKEFINQCQIKSDCRLKYKGTGL